MDKKLEKRMQILGGLVERKQKAERFTNREIWRLTGIPDQTIINIKRGKNCLFSKLLSICDIIGLDIQFVDRTTGDSITI